MASKRMFSLNVIDSDTFLDLPLTTQAVYFHLCMRADDDGFVNNPKKIQRMIRATDDDLKLLVAKQFLIPFDTGVVVIKHWRIHNIIRKDMYKGTLCTDEKGQIETDETGRYQYRAEHVTDTLQTRNEPGTDPNQPCYIPVTNPAHRLDKVRVDKVRVDKVSKEERKPNDPVGESNLSEPVKDKLREWLQYKAERREGYKPTGLKSLVTQVGKHEQQHGARAVIDIIDSSMGSGYKGILWEKIGNSNTGRTRTNRNGQVILSPEEMAEVAAQMDAGAPMFGWGGEP